MKIIQITDHEGKNTGKELRVRATPYTIKLYEMYFNSDLMADWGLVEFKVLRFIDAQSALAFANQSYEETCATLGIGDIENIGNMDDFSSADVRTINDYKQLVEEAAKIARENYDIEMLTFTRIVFAMAQAQNKADGKPEDEYDDWLLANDEMTVLSIFQDVADEVSNLFSGGGNIKPRERQQ